jgi:hypothetical protein
MNKKQSIMLAVTGVLLAAASQAQAQLNPVYANGDLLLNFRNATPGSTDPNVVVDLGLATTFAGLTGTTVLNTVANNGYTPLFSESQLTTTLGAPGSGNPIGFSAAGANGSLGAYKIFLTTSMSSPTLTPADPGIQQGNTAQTAVRNEINLIGQGASQQSGTPASDLTTLGPRVVAVNNSDANSYISVAQDPNTPGEIDYHGNESPNLGIETLQNGSGDIYEGLWAAPTTGHGSDAFLGYFTFQPNGEVDFTTSVPEPSTYVLLGLTGLLALGFRRQIRSLIA